MSPSTVVTPTRLYPLHCTLYLCTPTLIRRHLQALVALLHALVSDISFQFLRCALHWLQLRKLFKLSISLRNHTICCLISFCWKLTEATTTLNFEHVCFIARILPFSSHSSRPWAQPTDFYRLLPFNPVCPFYFCVSYFDLQTFLFCPNSISPFVSLCTTLLYSGYNFLFFLGRVPYKSLDFTNLFWTFKHDSWRSGCPCRCSSNCSG